MMIIIRKIKINVLLIIVGAVFVLIPIISLRLINNFGYINLIHGIELNSTHSMERAESLFRYSINLRDENPSAYRGLGVTLSTQGVFEEAQQVWRLISLDPLHLYLAWGDVKKIDGEYENALYWYKKAVEVDSENAKSWHQIGALQKEMGSVDKAIESYQKAYSLGWTESVQPLGLLIYKKKDFEEAKKIWNDALLRFPFDKDRTLWRRNIVYVYMTEEDWSGALNELESALSEYPDDPGLLHQKGISIYYQTGDVVKALVFLDQAISLDDEYASVYKGKGDVLYQEEKFQDAMGWYAKAIEIDPSNPSWYLAYARTADFTGDKALALEIYKDVTAHFPNHAYAHYELAESYYQNELFILAVDTIDQAISLSANPPISYYLQAARYYEAAGDLIKAEESYQIILILDPDNSTAVENLNRLQNYPNE